MRVVGWLVGAVRVLAVPFGNRVVRGPGQGSELRANSQSSGLMFIVTDLLARAAQLVVASARWRSGLLRVMVGY